MKSPPAQPTRRDTIIAVLLMMLCAAAVAIMTSSAKFTYGEGSNTETVLLLCAMVAVTLLGGYLLVSRGKFRIPAHLVLLSLVASLSATLMTYTWYEAINYLDISLIILIIFIHPLLAAFYFHLNGTTLLTPFRIFWGLAAFIGLGFALSVDIAEISIIGVGLSFLSALFATTLLISMVRINEQVGGVTTNFHMAAWSLVLFAILVVVTSSLQWPTSTLGWVGGIGNGFAYVTAYISFLTAARLVGGSRASVLSFMEPIATILLAVALFDEQLSGVQWGGVCLVMFGLIAMEAPKGTWSSLRVRLTTKLSPDRPT